MATPCALRLSVRPVNAVWILAIGLALVLPGTAQVAGQTITQLIDATGDGGGNTLDRPRGITVDAAGNVYVAGYTTHNAFKIEPDGTITEIIDSTGDGVGNSLDGPAGIAVDGSGNVYVAGSNSDNAFRIEPGGAITQIIDATGDGAGNSLSVPWGIAVDGSENVYVAAFVSNNAFKIEPGGAITEIIDSTGDGAGNSFNTGVGIAVDGSGNVSVTGWLTNNAFKIEPGGTIAQILDATGDGAGNSLSSPWGVAVDGSGNVYVTGSGSDNAFKIEPGGAITEIIDATGDGTGNPLTGPRGIMVDASENVYVSGTATSNAFRITPGGAITEIIDSGGDGASALTEPYDFSVAVDRFGNAYVTGEGSNNAFKIELVECQVTDPAALTAVQPSDWSGPGGAAAMADDFKPEGTSIGTVFVWGAYLDAQDIADTPADADPEHDCAGEVLDNFHVTVYNDGGGIPTTEFGHSTATVVKAIEPGTAYESFFGAAQMWGSNLTLVSPITGLTPGTCYWLEVVNNTSLPLGNTCVWNWAVADVAGYVYSFAGAGEAYAIGGERPVDMAFCSDAGLTLPGCGVWGGACCSCPGEGASCAVEALDICEFNNDDRWDLTDPTCGVACDAGAIPGDDCNSPIVVSDGVHVTDNHCTTVDGPSFVPTEAPLGADLDNDIWYTYTATCTGIATVSTCATGNSFPSGTSLDSVLAVYRDAGDPKNCIVCPADNGDLWPAGIAVDETCNGLADGGGGFVQWSASKGDCLLIRVSGFQGLLSTGLGMLQISCVPTDPFPDCNGNGVDDQDDIAGPTSTDCDGNKVPDDCDPNEDCNSNLVQDICDIAGPTSEDCNGNKVPDDCDIAGVTSNDCEPNTVPDECSIANCWSGSGDFPGCDDCNENDVSDECDIAGATSVDVDTDGVPDECIEWVGTSGNFSDGGSWEGGSPPGSGDPATIRGTGGLRDEASAAVAVAVTVDADATVASLRLLGEVTVNGPDVTLNVTEATQGNLTISGSGGLLMRGASVLVAHDRAIDVSNGEFRVAANGVYAAEPDSVGPVSATLTAASIRIAAGEQHQPLSDWGMTLEGEMSVEVSADLMVEGALDYTCAREPFTSAGGTVSSRLAVTPPTCPGGTAAVGSATGESASVASALGVIIPPKLDNCGSSVTSVSGDLAFFGALVAVNEARDTGLVLGGDFINHCVCTSLFNWSDGRIVLDGTSPQTFEVGGLDLGETGEGFLTGQDTLIEMPFQPGDLHTNFSVGVIEVAPGAEVTFVNNFGNTVGAGDCTEALYVHELILGAGSTVTVDNCKIYPEVLTAGENVTFRTIGCSEFGAPCVPSATPQPERVPDGVPQEDLVSAKNRVLSVTAGDAGRDQVIRVKAASLPTPFDELDCDAGACQVWYAGVPVQVCENSGQGMAPSDPTPPDCGAAPGLPQVWAWYAPLVCDPLAAHVMDWTTLTDYCNSPVGDITMGQPCTSDLECGTGTCDADGVIHLYHEAIVPSHMATSTGPIDVPAVYEVQVVEETCSRTADRNYSPALRLVPAGWGDVVRDCSGCPCTAPEESVGVITDVLGVLDKLSNQDCAPKKARADLQPRNLDFKIDILDVVLCLGGFTGEDYPFGTGQCVNGFCSGGPDHGIPCSDDNECSFDPCAPALAGE